MGQASIQAKNLYLLWTAGWCRAMRDWLSFGASVRGPGHIKTNTPNQDAWAAFHDDEWEGIVVSDGVGSKAHSDLGSRMLCEAVRFAVSSILTSFQNFDLDDEQQRGAFLHTLHEQWTELIGSTSPDDASATCLFGCCFSNGFLWLGMLGDGCAAYIDKSGIVHRLTEDKELGFSNLTTALSSRLDCNSWKFMSAPSGDCKAVVLCTDGVSDDLEDIDGFILAFSEAFIDMPLAQATLESKDMLEQWPTPKHSDDKTIACLFKRGDVDE